MYDEYQAAHIRSLCVIQNTKPPRSKKDVIGYVFLVSMIIAVVSQYIIDVIFKIITRQKFKEWFKVNFPWQTYYAAVISGGINGILLVILPSKLFAIAAVLVATITYEMLAGLTDLSTLNSEELVRSIVRDIFLILLVLYIINGVSGKDEGNDYLYTKEFDELFIVLLTSSIVINISLYLSRYGFNRIFGIDNDNSDDLATIDVVE